MNYSQIISYVSSTRLFWSTTDARKRTYYRFRVVEVQPKSNKYSQHHLGNNYDFTVPHDPSDPHYDRTVAARFAKDAEGGEFSDASTLSASEEDPNEFGDFNDFDSDEEVVSAMFIFCLFIYSISIHFFKKTYYLFV